MFRQFCDGGEIKHFTTAPYTQQKAWSKEETRPLWRWHAAF
jgi:hypothetical protein